MGIRRRIIAVTVAARRDPVHPFQIVRIIARLARFQVIQHFRFQIAVFPVMRRDPAKHFLLAGLRDPVKRLVVPDRVHRSDTVGVVRRDREVFDPGLSHHRHRAPGVAGHIADRRGPDRHSGLILRPLRKIPHTAVKLLRTAESRQQIPVKRVQTDRAILHRFQKTFLVDIAFLGQIVIGYPQALRIPSETGFRRRVLAGFGQADRHIHIILLYPDHVILAVRVADIHMGMREKVKLFQLGHVNADLTSGKRFATRADQQRPFLRSGKSPLYRQRQLDHLAAQYQLPFPRFASVEKELHTPRFAHIAQHELHRRVNLLISSPQQDTRGRNFQYLQRFSGIAGDR